MRAESGPDALETLNELKLRSETVAVFGADYRIGEFPKVLTGHAGSRRGSRTVDPCYS